MPQNIEPRLPKLTLTLSDSNSYKQIGSQSTYTVNLHTRAGDIIDVTADAIILSMDKNIFIDKDNTIIQFNQEGSGLVKLILKEDAPSNTTGKKVIRKYEFIVYDTFYKDNYLYTFFSTYDSNLIEGNPKLRAMFDTIMEFFDMFYAHRQDIKTIKKPREVKTKFLNVLGKNLGFPRRDFIEADTEFEKDANRVYRELLYNLGDLIELRGTPLSYELFFGALGYDVNILEYWYDSVGDLIEIHPTDPTQSTYLPYSTDGILLDSEPRPDPRPFASNETNVQRNNKSNFIRVVLSLQNEGATFPVGPSGFTSAKRKVIKNYLEFLRPMHVQYISEILSLDLAEEEIEDFFDQVDDITTAPLEIESLTEEELWDLWTLVNTTDTFGDNGLKISESIGEVFLLPSNIINDNDLAYDLRWDTFDWDDGTLFDTPLFFEDQDLLVSTTAPDDFVLPPF